MSLFDQLVDEVLHARADLSSLRPVVEKELLHHDILREMSAAGLLAGLTFMGGTCLRACYGSSRLSEDLDFTGGGDFRRRRFLPATAAGFLVNRRHFSLSYSWSLGSASSSKSSAVFSLHVSVPHRPGYPDDRNWFHSLGAGQYRQAPSGVLCGEDSSPREGQETFSRAVDFGESADSTDGADLQDPRVRLTHSP